MRLKRLHPLRHGLCVSFALAWLHAWTGSAQTAPPKELRVGLPLALSGIAAQQSENIRRGVEFARQDLEKAGWRVHLRYEDTTANAAQVVTVVKSLLSTGHRLIIGPTWSYMVAAAKPAIEQAGAVVISPVTSSELIDGPSPYVFNGIPRHSEARPAVSRWLKENNIRRAVILTSETTWGRLHTGVYQAAAKEVGTKIETVDSYPLDAEDSTVGMFVLKVKQLKPDAALLDLNKNGAALFLKKLGELHVPVKVLATTKFKEAVELGLVPRTTLSRGVWVLDLPMAPEFTDRYRQVYTEEPEISADSAYDSLMLLARAVEKTDGSPAEIRQFFRQMPAYRGYGGSYRFDEKGDCSRTQWVVRRLQ